MNDNNSRLYELEKLRESIDERKERTKDFWKSFLRTGVIMCAAIIVLILISIAWFVMNNRTQAASSAISAAGQADFALATLGRKDQGVYDSIFNLSKELIPEKIGDTEYYIASGNSSFRVDSDKNFNNYLANADLRPGNRGDFDLYIICRTDKREVELKPIFSAWHEEEDSSCQDAFSATVSDDIRTAAEFLKGHILLFASMDDKGMYSGNIDFTKNIKVDLGNKKASQTGNAEFSWGELVDSDDDTEVYRLPVYWVWPEQFGNFIYTGNSYNKNLFASKESPDYQHFLVAMEDDTDYKQFFHMEETVDRPPIATILSGEDYQMASKNYELYSSWYNAADEEIGTWISYIELGFEIAQDSK